MIIKDVCLVTADNSNLEYTCTEDVVKDIYERYKNLPIPGQLKEVTELDKPIITTDISKLPTITYIHSLSFGNIIADVIVLDNEYGDVVRQAALADEFEVKKQFRLSGLASFSPESPSKMVSYFISQVNFFKK